MLLEALQELLGHIYGIEVPFPVTDFLVTDRHAAVAIKGRHLGLEAEEELLVLEHDDEILVTLYLDRRLLRRLAQTDPRDALHSGNLGDFCLALEGISHFNYLAWNAAADRPVTQLEMEMQAEVDKYVAARVLLEAQADSQLTESLYGCLFANPRFRAQLDASTLARYRSANLYAGLYCRTLERRFPVDRVDRPMISDLRRFFRSTQPAKVSHIHTATYC